MGFRTVVVLYNDQASEWEKDPELGKKIAHGMNFAMKPSDQFHSPADLHYGRVIECAHADTQRLIAFDGYAGFWMPGESFYRSGDSDEAMKLRLLKEAASEMGYRLVKKSKGRA